MHEQLLSSIPLFESISDEDLSYLAQRLEHRQTAEGEIVFRQGDSELPSLYIVEEGAVTIYYEENDTRVELTTIYPGQFFGELSLFDGAPRSATAVAARPTKLLALHRDDFSEYVQAYPRAALAILSEMGERLRNSNELTLRQVSRNINQEVEEKLTFGQRVADRVATFGGSWTFIGLFSFFMAVWMTVNAVRDRSFDPFPFILLNLMLSTVAALQAPVIMMSQNRQSSKDKMLAQNDYEVNLKAEIEIARMLKGQAEVLARLNQIEREMGRITDSSAALRITSSGAKLGATHPGTHPLGSG